MGFFDELISWSEAYGENTAVALEATPRIKCILL